MVAIYTAAVVHCAIDKRLRVLIQYFVSTGENTEILGENLKALVKHK